MCGEKHNRSYQQGLERGSPPHVRGKEFDDETGEFQKGITPAYAGKSTDKAIKYLAKRDHPRVCGEKKNRLERGGEKADHPRMCGEKLNLLDASNCAWGSPPHVRGKAPPTLPALPPPRITPACAGKRLKRSRSTVPPVAIVPLFPSVCNKPVVSDGSPAGRDAPLFLPAENAVPASPACNLRSL